MSLPNLPDFDSLWDYSHPDQTETKFLELLPQFPEKDPARLELLTQIARAQGLQREFNDAHLTLDQVENQLSIESSRARVRYLLERGRVFNSSKYPEEARPFFKQALTMAQELNEDFYAVDAAHMLAIVADPPPPSTGTCVPSRWLNLPLTKKPANGSARFTTIPAGRITTWATLNQRWEFSRKPNPISAK